MDHHLRQVAGPSSGLSHVQESPAIGDPVSFASGQFAGRTIRFELQELQKAESGRKYVFPFLVCVSIDVTSALDMRKLIDVHLIRLLLFFCVYLSRGKVKYPSRGNYCMSKLNNHSI